ALGNLPGEGEYGHNVARGVNWILQQAKPNGLIQYTNQSKQAPVMYGQALAVLMLSEVWGQTRHRKGENDIGNVLRKAVDLIVQVQGPKGGWGYRSVPQDGDTSVCVMQIMALKSAQEAGIYVPDSTIDRALELVQTRYNGEEHIFGYRNTGFNLHLFGSSAAGTCINYVCGVEDERYTLEPLKRLFKGMESGEIDKVGHKEYYIYYSSVSAYAAGEELFAQWVQLSEPFLVEHQRSNGSWGDVHDTAFGVLAAALPYRYLPIYQR
ncbi:MAG: prenyltransferase/squalene oxidase repeat-containing protein, partial [Planctomycetota bacterium]